jgi:hypothetical protein
MKKIATYLVSGILSVLVIFLGVKLYQMQKDYNELKNAYVTTLTTANLELGQARTVIGDTSKLVDKLSKELQEQVKFNQATIERYAKLIAKLESANSGTLETPPTVVPLPPEIKSLPFKFDDFRLHVEGDYITKKFDYVLTQKFSLDMLELKTRDGQTKHIAKLYEIDDMGHTVAEADLLDFNVIVSDYNKVKRFEVWNPKLDLGLSVAFTKDHVTTPGLGLIGGLSFMSYGEKPLPSWRFARVNISYSKETVRYGITPVMLNIADKIPILSNIYMGVGLSTDFKSNESLDLSLSATL